MREATLDLRVEFRSRGESSAAPGLATLSSWELRSSAVARAPWTQTTSETNPFHAVQSFPCAWKTTPPFGGLDPAEFREVTPNEGVPRKQRRLPRRAAVLLENRSHCSRPFQIHMLPSRLVHFQPAVELGVGEIGRGRARDGSVSFEACFVTR